MFVETLAPAKDGGKKTEATGRGQQVHHGCLHYSFFFKLCAFCL